MEIAGNEDKSGLIYDAFDEFHIYYLFTHNHTYIDIELLQIKD